uniref:Uncharacterized protein n=1 Tax=Romanomermis culicivorax TaxID=13658 RepID=A0A915J009_ROMCU
MVAIIGGLGSTAAQARIMVKCWLMFLDVNFVAEQGEAMTAASGMVIHQLVEPAAIDLENTKQGVRKIGTTGETE